MKILIVVIERPSWPRGSESKMRCKIEFLSPRRGQHQANVDLIVAKNEFLEILRRNRYGRRFWHICTLTMSLSLALIMEIATVLVVAQVVLAPSESSSNIVQLLTLLSGGAAGAAVWSVAALLKLIRLASDAYFLGQRTLDALVLRARMARNRNELLSVVREYQ